MGTTASAIVTARPDAEHVALERLAELERLWSRFLPTSELSQLNRNAGRLVLLSQLTFAAVAAAVDAFEWSGGLFDPTILTALVNAGYDRSFERLPAHQPAAVESAPAPGCGGIWLDWELPGVCLPPDLRIDLGGIGKGLAADLVLAELMADGAPGACVNVGGDLAVRGQPPTSDGWIVGIDDPLHPGDELARVALASGAVATTSRMRRAWTCAGTPMHHVIDPRTGRPATSTVVAVTVIAASAAQAEVLAKMLLLEPYADEVRAKIDEHDAAALLVDERGRVTGTDRLSAFAA